MSEEQQEEPVREELPIEEGNREDPLQEAVRRADEYKEQYLRLLAELENAKKRMQKERIETIQYASSTVIGDFLNPLDHFESALKFAEQASGEVKNWAMGFQMILAQFKEIVSSHGVGVIPSQGVLFDPNLHEAVEIVETDQSPAGTILQELTKGYRMGSRVIRPARVKVAKERKKEENQ